MRELISELLPLMAPKLRSLGLEEGTWEGLVGPSTVSGSLSDVAMPCHSLSSSLGKSPLDIASEISLAISDSLEGIAVASSLNGFVNLSATESWLSSRVEDLVTDSRLGVSMDNPRIIAVDYSAPNVAKEMHVGHLRSTVIGDAIVRMLEFKGHTVHRENHVGDWGTPFGMLIEHLLDIGEDKVAREKGISDFDLFYKQARTKFDESSEFAERARARVVKLQSEEEETLRLWKILVDVSTNYFNEVYSMLGVLLTDEDLMGESAYRHLLANVVDRLSEIGILENSDGADVVYLGGNWINRDGEPFPVMIRKADGGFNYSTSDLACIIDRVERLGCDDLLYVVGTPQKQHFEMVFEVAKRSGFMNDEHRAVHVNFGSVLDSSGQMLKSRKGQNVKLVDLLREAVTRAESSISEKNPDLSGKERENVARMIGIGAVKYSDLSSDRTKDYVFDWDRMLSFEGNTAPYLQYAHARICSIFSRSGIERESTHDTRIHLATPEERALAKTLVTFPEAVDYSTAGLYPHRLCIHLHSIASSFASFYEVCHVLDEDKEVRSSRLAMCDLTARALSLGLGLLGIDCPERM